jgi:hypothetical protein
MLLRAVLVVLLVFLSLFAWRAWRQMPAFARCAAVLAAVTGLFLTRYPTALGIGVLLAFSVVAFVSSRKG